MPYEDIEEYIDHRIGEITYRELKEFFDQEIEQLKIKLAEWEFYERGN